MLNSKWVSLFYFVILIGLISGLYSEAQAHQPWFAVMNGVFIFWITTVLVEQGRFPLSKEVKAPKRSKK